MTRLTAFIDAWNTRDPEAVAACYAADGRRIQIAHPPARIEGRPALADHVREIMTAWPDCVLTAAPEDGEDGQVTLEWTFRGTQQAAYGPIPGEGQTLELRGVSVLQIDGGLIQEERVYWDSATLMASAGLLPS